MKKIAIILPCYNEAESMSEKLTTLNSVLSSFPEFHFDVLIVDDGSKDATKDEAEKTGLVKVLSYTPNHGKGYAVRAGLEYSLEHFESDYYIFMDVDMSTDLSAVPTMIQALEECPFVIGSRYDKDSKIVIKQPFKRRFISKCSRIIIKTMFNFKVKDTQCGFKGMNKEVASLLVEKGRIERFAFDVEYLYILKLNKIPYCSIPVIWSNDRGSTVKVVSSSSRFFKDLFKIKKHKKDYVIR